MQSLLELGRSSRADAPDRRARNTSRLRGQSYLHQYMTPPLPGNLMALRIKISRSYFYDIAAQVSWTIQDGRFLLVHTHGVRNGQHRSVRMHSCLAFNGYMAEFGRV